MSRVHFDSRLNSVEVDGFFADNDGNYYFNQMSIEPTQVIEFEVGEMVRYD